MGQSAKTTKHSSVALGRVSHLFLDEGSLLFVADLETEKPCEERGDVLQYEGTFS